MDSLMGKIHLVLSQMIQFNQRMMKYLGVKERRCLPFAFQVEL